jgi:demethylmenaquinone methyltransferase / 2-methoxy-6-polyprenyl-1,4-benzoquinol methylase
MSERTTDFGYTRVPQEEKAARVREVFDSVADRYDLMNDLMSLGLHRLWKRFLVTVAAVRPGQRVLDLAGGTGDLSALVAPRIGPAGEVVVADINPSMLARGRRRLTDAGLVEPLRYVVADAEMLPFPDASFDCVLMAFGLRNVTRKERALAEMYRVLRPGGLVLVLEFSQPRVEMIRPLYDLYSFRVLPWLGRRIAGDADSYRYLAESIRVHPDQQQLARMLADAGFENCEWFNLALGVVALHRGRRM